MNAQIRKKILLSALAGGIGFLVNMVNIEMFFGVNIIFGGILPMVIVLAYGPRYGGAAALIASSYTYFLWGHPYAIIIFTLEAVVVGFVAFRNRQWVLGSNLVFWLLIGMPLVYVFYNHVLSLSLTSTLLIALKQTTNALFNLSIAGALLLWKPLRSRLLEEHFSLPTLSNYISTGLMLFIGLILFAETAYQGRDLYRELNQEIRSDLQEKARTIQQSLDPMLETLYKSKGDNDILAAGRLSQQDLAQTLGTFNKLFSDSGTRLILTGPEQRIVFPRGGAPHELYSLDTSNLEVLEGGFTLKFPAGEKPAMVRWGESVMVYSVPLPSLGGTLHLEQPQAEYQGLMQDEIIDILLELFLLMSSFIVITSLISTYLNRQMKNVMIYAEEVQQNVENDIPIKPRLISPIREMDTLSGNIRHSALEIQRLLHSERVHSVQLQETLQELKQMQIEMELQTSQHARMEAFRDFVHTIGNLITPARVKTANLIVDRHADHYFEQLLSRVKLIQERMEQGALLDYLREDGKNDLAGIINGLELLHNIESKTMEELVSIDNTLEKVVESTTSQSRLQMELSLLEDVDLIMVIRAVLSILEDNWKAKGIRSQFKIESSDGSPPLAEVMLNIEKVRLFSMIQNVLKNAGETFDGKLEADKRIDVVLRSGPEGIVLEVTDNGNGISPEDLRQVGQIGFTTKRNTTPGEGGSGLGIHNCKLFMSRAGGRFELNSDGQNKGATATMIFPKEMRR